VTVHVTVRGQAHRLEFTATAGTPFFTVRETGPGTALILSFVVR